MSIRCIYHYYFYYYIMTTFPWRQKIAYTPQLRPIRDVSYFTNNNIINILYYTLLYIWWFLSDILPKINFTYRYTDTITLFSDLVIIRLIYYTAPDLTNCVYTHNIIHVNPRNRLYECAWNMIDVKGKKLLRSFWLLLIILKKLYTIL